jgi:FMN-dependent oxidoreductase (nitrilotriacetate monooxygenase family)
MTKKFHLGWFTNFCADPWNGPFSNGGEPWDGRFFVEFAQALERACFDYILFEDKVTVPDVYGGSSEVYLKHPLGAPKHDPAPLAAMIAGATSHIGLVCTLSTMAYPPFLLARLASTLDSLSRGRFGWNIVTSAEDTAAQNFGLDALPPRELRYDMADEYVDLAIRLWRSWAPDTVKRDRDGRVYADFTKVAPVNFEGRYFKCRGPLNTAPSPQIVPTLVQAGGSPRGRDFAAKYADSIVAAAAGLDGMKAFRDDIRARAAAQGRNPDDIKVLFMISPVLAQTEAEARADYERLIGDPDFLEQSLAIISAITSTDFSKFPLDEPLPGRLTTNGEQGTLDAFQRYGEGKTLRQLVEDASGGLAASIELIGTPDQVADKMGEAMEAVGGDGFLITMPGQTANRIDIAKVCDGLVPALQRRGLVRDRYEHALLRDNLRAF